MIGRDFSDIYIAACGEHFDMYRQGIEHEKYCPACAGGTCGERVMRRHYQVDIHPILYRIGVMVLTIAITVVGMLAAREVFFHTVAHANDAWEAGP